ncbi:MAG: hypothetical protein M1814_000322 [Vezdaea aestivalis]|nr:MAG: hypothetical protein M1814_000322 [Vezdaea aestivalis]
MSTGGGGSLDAIIHRRHPNWFQRFFQYPMVTLAKSIYEIRNRYSLHPASHAVPITVVCISDTHNAHPPVPGGDLLIHAGDLTQVGSIQELQATIDWLKTLPHKHKVVIAGNHDVALESEASKTSNALSWGDIVYLQDTSVDLRFPGGRKLNIFGSPWTRKHGNWAFQYPKGEDVWTGRIPPEVDVLVTHGAPRFHLDIEGWGDDFLLREIWRTKPALHVFGHLHGGFGQDLLICDQFESTYEEIRRVNGGFLKTLKLLVLLAIFLLGRRVERGTKLVNAATVGGLRDQELRPPVVLKI